MKYEFLFSPCARPIKSLKGKARELRKKHPELGQIEALDKVANEIGYRSWADMQGRCSLPADQFFQTMFSLRHAEEFQELYGDYLSKMGLLDSKDAIRQHMVDFLGETKGIWPSVSGTETWVISVQGSSMSRFLRWQS